MSTGRLIVSTSYRGVTKKQVWDCSRPMLLCRPERWRLESLGGGIRLTAPGGSRCLDFAHADSRSGISAELSPSVSVRIEPLRTVTPAYLQPSAQAPVDSETVSLAAYGGIGSQLTSCTLVKHAYVAYSRTRPVFTLKLDGAGAVIKPLLHGVEMVIGREIQQLQADTTYDIETTDLLDTRFKWGVSWWSLRLVNRQLEVFGEGDPDFEEPTNGWFRKLLASAIVVLSGGLAALLMLAPEPPKKIVESVSIRIQPKTVIVPASAIQPLMERKSVPEVVAAAKEVAAPLPQQELRTVQPLQQARRPHSVALRPRQAGPALAGGAQPGSAKATISAGLRTLQDPGARILAQNQELLQSALGDVVSAMKSGSPGVAGARAGSGTAAGTGGTPGAGGSVAGFGGPGKGGGLVLPGGESVSKGFFEGGVVSLTPTAVQPNAVAVPKTSVTRMQDYAGARAVGGGRLPASVGQVGGVGGQGYSFVGLEGEEARVEEGLTRSEVDGVIRAHMHRIKFCHESAAVYRSDLDGKVVVAFTIGANGVVVRPTVHSSTLSDPRLEQCIVGALSALRFQKPRGKVTVSVSYPFVFKTLGRPR